MNYVVGVSLIAMLSACVLGNSCLAANSASLHAMAFAPIDPVIVAGRAARTVSAKSLQIGGKLAGGMMRHPRLSALCIAGILVAVPRLRRAVWHASSRGASMIGSLVSRAFWARIHSFFFGGIQSSLDRAHTTLGDHTSRLNTIQTGVTTLRGQVKTMSDDVAGVKLRAHESYDLLIGLRQSGQVQGQELATVNQKCDELSRSISRFVAQLAGIHATINAHESASQKRNQQLRDLIDRYLRENEAGLAALVQQLAEVKTSINLLSEKIGTLESNQGRQFEQLNEALQQILQCFGQLLTMPHTTTNSGDSVHRSVVNGKGQPCDVAAKAATS